MNKYITNIICCLMLISITTTHVMAETPRVVIKEHVKKTNLAPVSCEFTLTKSDGSLVEEGKSIGVCFTSVREELTYNRSVATKNKAKVSYGVSIVAYKGTDGNDVATIDFRYSKLEGFKRVSDGDDMLKSPIVSVIKNSYKLDIGRKTTKEFLLSNKMTLHLSVWKTTIKDILIDVTPHVSDEDSGYIVRRKV